MNVGGVPHRTIRRLGQAVEIVDQTLLPDRFQQRRLRALDDVVEAIATMRVRGAPLIGVTAAYGVALALAHDPSDASLGRACAALVASRPTAVNLAWAVGVVRDAVRGVAPPERAAAAFAAADAMAEADVAACRGIGEHGAAMLRDLAPGRSVLRVMTHCNAGWLATVDGGTALAPIYQLHDAGVPVHVWTSETRPRNQGRLTAWELREHGVPHTVVVDNAAGHLMQRGEVDVVLVGTDRVTRAGDVTNKIGTYLKALAARAADIPFLVAAPSSSIDWSAGTATDVPIEERAAAEVDAGPSPVANPAFDVTPAHLVTALITERGVCAASAEGLAALFPEHA